MKTTILKSLTILAFAIIVSSCEYKELPTGFDCSKSDLQASLVTKTDATSCKSINGQITMAAKGGVPPYDYSLGDGVYQTNPVFTKLAAGSYNITVKDIKGCKNSVQVEVAAEGSNLTATITTVDDSQCLSDNGSVTLVPVGGSSPYLAKVDGGTFGSTTTFLGLGSGVHSFILKDANDCEKLFNITVGRGNTGVSYASDIAPIFAVNCNLYGCHGAGTTGRDWTKYGDVKNKAASIASRTANRSMPIGGFTLTVQQIQQIACWVDDGANNN